MLMNSEARESMSNPGTISADAASLAAIIKASYDVISGPAGQARDWERFRSLYAPGARLMPVVGGDSPHVRTLGPEEYIRRVEPIFAVEDFWERETSREVQRFGRIAHVVSHYESVRKPNEPAFETGTNSMQLFYDDTRWWIVSVMWNTARAE
jgi:hypothetical protein